MQQYLLDLWHNSEPLVLGALIGSVLTAGFALAKGAHKAKAHFIRKKGKSTSLLD